MPKRSKKPRDTNSMAAAIVAEATSDEEPGDQKDPVMSELGRRGGLKGGRSRAERLTKTERSEIARKAARARWRRQS